MKLNKRILGMLLMLFFAFLFPLSIMSITSSETTSTIKIEDINVQISQSPTNVVINEVYFDDVQDEDKGEFVELYNPTEHSINISYWTITDEEPGVAYIEGIYQFPNGTFIPSRGFIIIFQDINESNLISPDDVANSSLVQLFETISTESDEDDARVANLTKLDGTWDLKLANSGDEVFLRDSENQIVDAMSYGPTPYTTNVPDDCELKLDDGSGNWEGYSIERAWTSWDWAKDGSNNAIKMNPTPGAINGTVPSQPGEDPFGDGIPDNIVINEIYFGLQQTDSFNGENGWVTWQLNQFIEIYNPTDHNINVTGWTIEDNDGTKWEFVEGKHADELGDSDMLLIWPDRNDEDANDTYIDPDDNYSPWYQWWNNVDMMETYYTGDDFRWWWDCKDNDPTEPSYNHQYELHPQTSAVADFHLDTNDYVILRNKTGGVVDVVCWGTGYYALSSDAKSVVGDQNAGSYHGISENESLERIWQNHYPVADFLYGPGVYHLPTPGKVVGDVPDEIEDELTFSDDWEVDAGTTTRDDCNKGIIIQTITTNGTHISVDKWSTNPKDHLTEGNLTLNGVVFWRLLSNNTIDPITITLCYGTSSFINESTLKLHVWDHEAESWEEITTSQDKTNNRITGSTILNSTVSDTLWIGLFGESSLDEIPGFECAFVIVGLISIIAAFIKWKTKETKLI
ncbi:MAG: lamin tail domain-containing protein [Promethearchaeota archaeon]